jgi:leucyl-tRNA synthetase
MRAALETANSLLFPFAPHAAADGYHRLTGERVWEEPWPVADPALLERDTFELVVQVNGKVRDRVEVPVGLPEDELVSRARALPRVTDYLDGRELRKAVVVPGKLVNLVI